MKFTIPLKPFRTAFATAAAASSGRTPLPILQNVKFSAKAGTLTLTGSNSETSVRVKIEADVKEDGDALAPTATVTQLLRAFTGDSVSVETDGNAVVFRCGNAKNRLQSPAPDEFPNPPTAPGYCFTGSGEALSRALLQVLPAIDTESTRYALGGVCFHTEDGRLMCVATDTRRLHLVPVSGQVTSELKPVVVPAVACKAIARMTDGDVAIGATASMLFASQGDIEVATRLVEGVFPKYLSVIPKSEHAISVLVGGLAPIIESANVTTSVESTGVDFTITPDQLTVSSEAAEVGGSECSLPISGGVDCKLRLNGRFVLETLKMLPDEAEVRIDYTDEDTAVQIHHGESLFLVMPIGERQ